MPWVTSHDGLPLAVDVRPGDGTSSLFVHATGFCKETWLPVLDHLPDVPAISIDQRGHGASGRSSMPFDWWDLGADVETILEEMQPYSPVGVGHSSGGAALAMAEIERPGSFSALILIEPIIHPPPFAREEDGRLALQALRRRTSFDSAESAFASFHGRGPFARWVEEALRAYVEHGTIADEEGGRRLACPPEVEAEFYRAAYAHGAWARLDGIGCPVVVVVGEDSDTHTAEFTTSLTERFADARSVTIEGATHFVPMEKPEEVAAIVRDVIAG
ncbi:MAG TPA: alpha/beta hydrolase [Acidimicrobiia bacterium]|nr:alpha/beta hydrolase [Acidimicrobiia bacterium]